MKGLSVIRRLTTSAAVASSSSFLHHRHPHRPARPPGSLLPGAFLLGGGANPRASIVGAMTVSGCCRSPGPGPSAAAATADPSASSAEALAVGEGGKAPGGGAAVTASPAPPPPPAAAAAAAPPPPAAAAPAGKPRAPPSFYRRPLPDTCVALPSREGRRLFKSALRHGGLKSFFSLVEQHATQSEPAYCGVSTLTVALNALAVDPRQNWKGPWRWYEESMLNCCMDLEDVKRTGITMRVFHCLAQCQGLASAVYHANDEACTLEHLRDQVRAACVEEGGEDDEPGEGDEKDEEGREHDGQLRHVLVVSYDRQTLGQTGSGHFSPIGAYDPASDSVLILDTARFKYGAHWVGLPLLYEAMKPVDPDTGRSRGYIMLTHDPDDHRHHGYSSGANSSHSSSSALPMSILFRSRMRQYEARREYKRFLRSLEGREPTWDDAVRFWTRDLTSRDYVWASVDAQVKPCSNEVETVSLLRRVRALIAASIPPLPVFPASDGVPSSSSSSCVSSCRPNGLRSLDLKPEEAIFVAYLAALDEDRRRQVLEDAVRSRSGSSPAGGEPDEEALLQLLAEAELVRYAIDLSDQQPSM